MKKLMNTINYGSMLMIALVIGIFFVVSNDDHQQALSENQHWCDEIAKGRWYAGQDEIAQRCGG